MTQRVQTLIVGAGQAGLALSRCLTRTGHDHIILERGLVGQRWRSERWDSFRLLTPNWYNRLPGWEYTGHDPDGFMDRREVISWFERYAESFDAPVRTGVSVSDVYRADHGWSVHTDAGRFDADNVVIASGHYDRAQVPQVAQTLPRRTHQLHSRRYRNPARIPPGGVLVVGAGPSGQQIADELARAGRRVFLSVGRHRPLPRRYRGRDVYYWMDRSGMLDRTVDTLPDPLAAQQAPSVVLAGEPENLDLRRMVRNGVVPVGRMEGIDGEEFRFAADLPERLHEADDNVRRIRAAVDRYVARTGLHVPEEPFAPTRTEPWVVGAPRRLHLLHDGINTVIWATGFSRDFSWIHAPVFHAQGDPVQHRGVTAAEGLYFLGLRWMHRRESNFIGGVGGDAEYLAQRLSGVRDLRAVG
jgi:putative flavoprotein involved in K+ transport